MQQGMSPPMDNVAYIADQLWPFQQDTSAPDTVHTLPSSHLPSVARCLHPKLYLTPPPTTDSIVTNTDAAAYAHNPALPQEMIDQVVDCLRDDRATLRKMSMASRALLRSRRLLFKCVTIKGMDDLARFRLLASRVVTLPDVAQLVDELCINSNNAHPRWILSAVPILRQKLITIAKRDRPVSVLRFRGCDFHHLAPEERSRLVAEIGPFNGVQEIGFHACSFLKFGDLEAFVLSFPSLSRLTLEAVWERFLNSSSLMGSPAIKLSNIRIITFPVDVLRCWMLRTRCTLSLRSVEFGPIQSLEDTVAAGLFLKDLGTSLTHLKIGFAFPAAGESNYRHVNQYMQLNDNTSLTSLHLNICNLERKAVSWVPELLCRISLCPITRITLQLSAYFDWQLATPEWRIIPQILAQSQRLQEVVLVFSGHWPMERLWKVLKENWPDWDPRLLLKIQHAGVVDTPRAEP